MQTAQQQPIPGPEVDLALDRATQELNTSYMDLCARVERLTQELHQSRPGRAAAGRRRVRRDYQVGRDGDEKVDLGDGRAAVLSAHAFRAATPEKNNRRSGGR